MAVIGRSGAGKTTLLRCLTCATAVSSGHIWIGADNLGRRLSVLDNVLIGSCSSATPAW